MIKVVHITYATYSAGSSALRLHNAFLEANIDSNVLAMDGDTVITDRIKRSSTWSRLKAKLDNRIHSYLSRKYIKQLGRFSYPILGTNVSQIEQIKKADFIYIHWVVNGFLNIKSIDQLAKSGKPIIVYMHDMWPITGGCHYSFTCDKYKTHCNDCPVFPRHKKKDLSFLEFEKKLKLYSKYNNFYFVSPSKWLYDCAENSFLTKKKPIFYIPYILDNTIFKPLDKKIAKQILNINSDEIVIAFGAIDIDSPYKGWSYIQKALEILNQNNQLKNISILIFGSCNERKIADAIPFKTKFMGYLKDAYSTSLVYNAADVFVVPSLADNLPNVVIESMWCGTPVVGFDVGGIPDMIKHKENGYLAKYKDPNDIAEGIKFCIENKIKGYALSQFEPKIIIDKHLVLFEQIHLLN